MKFLANRLTQRRRTGRPVPLHRPFIHERRRGDVLKSRTRASKIRMSSSRVRPGLRPARIWPISAWTPSAVASPASMA